MTDLTARLLDETLVCCGADFIIRCDAADEIDRLSLSLEKLNEENTENLDEIDRLTGEVSRQQEAIEVALESVAMFNPESVKHAQIQMMTIAQTLSEAHDPQFRTDFQVLKDRLTKADALAEVATRAKANLEGANKWDKIIPDAVRSFLNQIIEDLDVALTAYGGDDG